MNDNNLNGFKGYLISKSAVNEKYAPYYVRWVSSCYAFVNQSLSDVLTNGQKQDFLKHFAKNHEDWQVKQAEAALLPRCKRRLKPLRQKRELSSKPQYIL
ncbi:MAG: hypothetical protein ACOYU2_05095 [Nitrospirota bacterium]